MLHAADRCNQGYEAFRLYDEMLDKKITLSGPHFVPLIRLASRQRGQRGLDKALALKKYMLESNIGIDTFTCSALVEAHKVAGDAKGAINTWEEIRALSNLTMTAPLLSALLSAVARNGDVDATIALLREADGHFKPNNIHYNCVLDACKRAGDADAALRFFQEFQKNGVQADVISFTILMSTLRHAGRPRSEMEGVLEQMKALGVKADKFFLEEHLSFILGLCARSLADGFPEAIQAFQASDQREVATAVIRQAIADGIQLSRIAIAIYEQLEQSEPVAAAAQAATNTANGPAGVPTATEQWVKVVVAQPTAGSPSEYFWERISGRTQWEPPATPVLETMSA